MKKILERKSMKTILMCEPNSFAVNYDINPWMSSSIGKVDKNKAHQQWKDLSKKIKDVGHKVVVMHNQPEELPDLVFTANAALTINNHALISNFACVERQAESTIYSEYISGLGLKIDNYFVHNDIYFEGAGDALLEKNKNILVLGYGFRTSRLAKEYVQEWLKMVSYNTKLMQVELINPNYYHLDTCFCPLDNGYVLYYPGAFSEKSNNELKDTFQNKLISVSEEDASFFACNAVSLDNCLILNRASTSLQKKLNSLDITVVETPLNQYMLSGGSAKCLTLELSLKVI